MMKAVLIELNILICLLDDAAAGVFCGLLSASFCGALRNRRNRRIFWCGLLLMLIPRGTVYLLWGAEFQMKIDPLLLHLPLLVLLCRLTGKRLWPAVSILSACLFCQPRRWPALLAAAVLPGEELAQKLAELAVTVPLLLILLRFAAPAVRRFMDHPVKEQCQFGLAPALYCGFDYLTRAYMGLSPGGFPAAEFMPTVCCAAYLVFLSYSSAEEFKRGLCQQARDNLELQMAQSAREIGALRESQAQAARFRHDFRHHLQYLLTCIENSQTERAKDYISGICAEIEAQRVRRWCENEAANLILSSFDERAEKMRIRLDIKGALPAVSHISDSDLCIILSNALENALQACLPLTREGADCTIGVVFRFQQQIGRLILLIANPCREEVRFERGVPVSDQPGHGIGVQSICAIAERYGGSCTFLAENGRFILRLYL